MLPREELTRRVPRAAVRVVRTALLLGALPAGLAAQPIPVSVGVGAIESGAGVFDLPITIDMSARTELLGSFALTVRWDPSVLQLVGGSEASFGQVTVNSDSLAVGKLLISGANPAGVGGLVTVAVGRFTVLVNDTTTFRLSVQELYAAGSFADLTAAAVAIDRQYCGSTGGTWGDVDRNGTVEGADALIVLSEAVGLNVSQYALPLGDVDSSGTRNPRDALIILSYAIGINTAGFRVGQAIGGAVCTQPGALGYGMDPVSAQPLIGQEVAFFAFGLDSAGAALALTNVTWASTVPGVATVDSFGLVTAVGTGTTTIEAWQDTVMIATGAITVPAGRAVHWVDALADRARNQLGTQTHPFRDIGDAVGTAAPGDTVRVRPGAYPPFVVDRTLVVLGDTSGGGARPRIVNVNAAPGVHGAILGGGGDVELRLLEFDRLYVGIEAVGVNAVRLRDLVVTGASSSYGAVAADQVTTLRVEGSTLIGGGNLYGSGGIDILSLDSLFIDGTLISDFGGNGVDADDLRYASITASTIRYNAGYGLWLCSVNCQFGDTLPTFDAVITDNRFTQNANGAVYMRSPQRADFARNVLVGGGYDGFQVYGHLTSVIASTADSMMLQGGYTLFSASRFDTLLVDQPYLRDGAYGTGIYANGGYNVVVTDADFMTDDGYGVYVFGLGLDSTSVLVRRGTYLGGNRTGQYYGSGYGVQVYDATLTVEDAALSAFYVAVGASNARAILRRTAVSDVYYGTDVCGSIVVDTSSIVRSYYALSAYQCSVADTIAIDSLEVADAWYAVDAGSMDWTSIGRVGASRVEYGVRLQGGGDGEVLDSRIDAYADPLYLYGMGSLQVARNQVTCLTGTGIETYALTGRARISGNVVGGTCDQGIEADFLPWAFVDSNTVSGVSDVGILVYRVDSAFVYDNLVTGLGPTRFGTAWRHAGIAGYENSTGTVMEIRRNRVEDSRAYGISVYRTSADTVTVVLDSNAVRAADTTGIQIDGYTKVLARYNAIDSAGFDAVQIDRAIAGDTTVRFTLNNFTNSGRYGFYNRDGGSIPATDNWWGDAAGPSGFYGSGQSLTGDSVSVGVLWNPALSAPANAPVPTPPAALTMALQAAADRTAVRRAPTIPEAIHRMPAPTRTPLPGLRVRSPDGLRGELRSALEERDRRRQRLVRAEAEATRPTPDRPGGGRP